ncbi:MAG: GTP-binding protein [Deltaproteobacteria bacterium]|nr:GTP-binding protein [Deltaproteobacteria bacterium]
MASDGGCRSELESSATIIQSACVIPTLIVSGFLGSGKTSLVRWLLSQAQSAGKRVAVVSNEYNSLGIDQALLGADGQTLVELDGGCVCCQLSNELVATLEMLHEKVQPDQIIIETSGVALPGDVQVHLWREPVKSWSGGDVAVVIVNAEQVLEGRDLDGAFEFQLTSADLLVLNKLDLVPDGALPAIEARLRQIEPDAPMVRCLHGRVDPAVLFPPDADQLRQRRATRSEPPAHLHERFASEVINLEEGIDEAVLTARFRAMNALRAKGFVQTANGARLLQAVGPRVQLEAVAAASPELLGKVVVIRRVQ